ncbi:unnamed protein product, partial [Amoebophrya sp. A25]
EDGTKARRPFHLPGKTSGANVPGGDTLEWSKVRILNWNFLCTLVSMRMSSGRRTRTTGDSAADMPGSLSSSAAGGAQNELQPSTARQHQRSASLSSAVPEPTNANDWQQFVSQLVPILWSLQDAFPQYEGIFDELSSEVLEYVEAHVLDMDVSEISTIATPSFFVWRLALLATEGLRYTLDHVLSLTKSPHRAGPASSSDGESSRVQRQHQRRTKRHKKGAPHGRASLQEQPQTSPLLPSTDACLELLLVIVRGVMTRFTSLQ